MSKGYSKVELEAIAELLQKHGHLTYQNPEKLADEFYQKTGIKRASGALYMAAWRLEKGYYDKVLQSS